MIVATRRNFLKSCAGFVAGCAIGVGVRLSPVLTINPEWVSAPCEMLILFDPRCHSDEIYSTDNGTIKIYEYNNDIPSGYNLFRPRRSGVANAPDHCDDLYRRKHACVFYPRVLDNIL